MAWKYDSRSSFITSLHWDIWIWVNHLIFLVSLSVDVWAKKPYTFYKYENHAFRLCKIFVVSLSHVQLFCDSMDCSPPGSTVHGISQARILEKFTISFSRGSSRLRDQTHISCLTGRFFTTELPGKSDILLVLSIFINKVFDVYSVCVSVIVLPF